MPEPTSYCGPAIVEVMGHRRIAGLVSEVTQFGVVMCRVDVPDYDQTPTDTPLKIVDTQFYPGSALFSVHPCTFDDMMKDIMISRPIGLSALPHRQSTWEEDFDEIDEDDRPLSDEISGHKIETTIPINSVEEVMDAINNGSAVIRPVARDNTDLDGEILK